MVLPHPDLLVHAAQFEKRVVEVAPRVWTAVGYAASNVHMIEGAESLTIIDTTESTKAAENILAEFRKLTDKPVGRIIYTHSHRDHISGAFVFADGDIPILAHHLFSSDLVTRPDGQVGPDAALGRRTQAQFGIGLSSQERISLGLGPGNRPMEGLGAGHIAPNMMIEQDCDIDLGGMSAQLIFAPGETRDHMLIWLPEARVLIGGDNWYHAFPNLYAIRGTPYRDFQLWANSLEVMAGLNAEVLAAGHTQPVIGAAAVQRRLLSTRAAILHVIQHTAAGMNGGLSLDDIAASITLPEALADDPWLKEYYGKLSWSAKAYAVGTLGWYDGNPTHLGTLSDAARAAEMATLAGGEAALLSAAEGARDPQWRLELCDHLSALGHDMRALKAETMRTLAEVEINATARNTYIWEAKRLTQSTS